MNTERSQTSSSTIVVVILGIVAILLAVVVATGSNLTLPIISTYRAALIAMTVVGVAMCAVGGIGPYVSKYGWSNPMTILGTIIGVLTILVVGAILLGVQLPIITDDRAAFIFVTGVVVLKLVINGLVWLFRGDVT